MKLECGCSDVAEPLQSIEAACARVVASATAIKDAELVALQAALGRVLADPIHSAYSLPQFDQSAMDGFAVYTKDLRKGSNTFLVSQRILAGDVGAPLTRGTAARIFTGAPIPEGADAVIMQEAAVVEGNEVTLVGPVEPGANVRKRGRDVLEGEHLMDAGVILRARHLALLAAQGMDLVSVRRRPVAAVFSTGSELRQPGSTLSRGTIFDSNRPMLIALAEQTGFTVLDGGCLPDDSRLLERHLSELTEKADLLVTSAGASVGDEDNSFRAATAAGFSCEALRIAMKPGKPAIVGHRGACAYLGLPGNPLSAFISWSILGAAMAAGFAGRSWSRPLGVELPAGNEFHHKPGRTEFVPARIVRRDAGTTVELLGQGVSGHLKPLTLADGLVEIDRLAGTVAAGDVVRFHPFGSGW